MNPDILAGMKKIAPIFSNIPRKWKDVETDGKLEVNWFL